MDPGENVSSSDGKAKWILIDTGSVRKANLTRVIGKQLPKESKYQVPASTRLHSQAPHRPGIEDYSTSGRPRLLSAVRNVYAGILLLHKEVLRRKSPPNSAEPLISVDLVPFEGADGRVSFVGSDKKKRTVGTQEIIERFKALGLSGRWKELRRPQRVRNDAEHYYVRVDQETMRATLSDVFIVIHHVLRRRLNVDPHEELGEDAYRVLIQANEVQEEERKRVLKELDDVDWLSPIVAEGVLLQKRNRGRRNPLRSVPGVPK